VSLLLIFSLSLSLARLFIYDSLFFCTELQRAVRMRRQRLTEVILGAHCVSEAQRCAKASSIITYTRTHTPHTHTYVCLTVSARGEPIRPDTSISSPSRRELRTR